MVSDWNILHLDSRGMPEYAADAAREPLVINTAH